MKKSYAILFCGCTLFAASAAAAPPEKPAIKSAAAETAPPGSKTGADKPGSEMIVSHGDQGVVWSGKDKPGSAKPGNIQPSSAQPANAAKAGGAANQKGEAVNFNKPPSSSAGTEMWKADAKGISHKGAEGAAESADKETPKADEFYTVDKNGKVSKKQN